MLSKKFLCILLTLSLSLFAVPAYAMGPEPESTDTDTVYVYLAADNGEDKEYPESWEVNSSGYYTLGKIEIGNLTPGTVVDGTYFTDEQFENVIANIDNIIFISEDKNININQVQWTGLKWENGANDYLDYKVKCWHLDGTIDAKYIPYYTVTYQNEDGSIIQSTGKLNYGDETPYCEPPTKESEEPELYTWEFNGWDYDVADTVFQDMTYTATFVKVEIPQPEPEPEPIPPTPDPTPIPTPVVTPTDNTTTTAINTITSIPKTGDMLMMPMFGSLGFIAILLIAFAIRRKEVE